MGQPQNKELEQTKPAILSVCAGFAAQLRCSTSTTSFRLGLKTDGIPQRNGRSHSTAGLDGNGPWSRTGYLGSAAVPAPSLLAGMQSQVAAGLILLTQRSPPLLTSTL